MSKGRVDRSEGKGSSHGPGTERLIVGISGASGVIYAVRLLEILKDSGIETHLVMSRAAELTIAHELDRSPRDVRALASKVHPVANVGAAIASGSFITMGMIIAPCSIRTMSEIATGVTSSLLTRAADVCLKERRPLVLAVRETPLHAGHLRTMAQLSDLGAIIAPVVPSFYARPQTLEEMIDHTVGRLLDQVGVHSGPVRRWTGEPVKPQD